MSDYHRIYHPGGIFFFTVVTYKRSPFLTLPTARATLRASWRTVQQQYPFFLIALCLLPDHLHCMWKMIEADPDYSKRWQKIKEGFSKTIDRTILPFMAPTESMVSKREAPIWQRRFWEHTIRDQIDYNRHFDYIHFNPVKHGYVQKAVEWPWSTFHRYLTRGIYDPDWGDISSQEGYNLTTIGE
ncbi:MAG: transposase [bacterium]